MTLDHLLRLLKQIWINWLSWVKFGKIVEISIGWDANMPIIIGTTKKENKPEIHHIIYEFNYSMILKFGLLCILKKFLRICQSCLTIKLKYYFFEYNRISLKMTASIFFLGRTLSENGSLSNWQNLAKIRVFLKFWLLN